MIAARPATDELEALLAQVGDVIGGCPMLVGPAAPRGREWLAIDRLADSEVVEEWLERVAAIDPTGPVNRRACTSFICGWLAAGAAAPGVAMIACAERAPDLAGGGLRVCRAGGGWCEALHLRRGCLLAGAGCADEFGAGLVQVLSPVVDQLCALTGRRPRVLWGGVIDAVYLTAVHAQLRGVDYVRAVAMWTAADRVADAVQEHAGVGELRRARPMSLPDQRRLHCRRATCCLAYTTPSARARAADGEQTRCSTCPLVIT